MLNVSLFEYLGENLRGHSCSVIPSFVFRPTRLVRAQLVVEAIGGKVTKESKVRDNCDNYDVRGI